jgi:hypothetical protein
MTSAYERNLPVSVVELVVFCGVLLSMCCMVVFWTFDLCSSIEDALELNVEPAELPPACTQLDGKRGKNSTMYMWHTDIDVV